MAMWWGAQAHLVSIYNIEISKTKVEESKTVISNKRKLYGTGLLSFNCITWEKRSPRYLQEIHTSQPVLKLANLEKPYSFGEEEI